MISSVDDGSWLFSGENENDIVEMDNSIVSGSGSDVIHLYGSDNIMLFYDDFDKATIFNQPDSDSLVFMENPYIKNNDSYLNHLSFIDDNALLTFGESSVTLGGMNADMLSDMYIALPRS